MNAIFEQKTKYFSSYGRFFRYCSKGMMKDIFSVHAYCDQKSYVCIYLTNSKDMKVGKFVTYVAEIKSFFVHFPSETCEYCKAL